LIFKLAKVPDWIKKLLLDKVVYNDKSNEIIKKKTLKKTLTNILEKTTLDKTLNSTLSNVLSNTQNKIFDKMIVIKEEDNKFDFSFDEMQILVSILSKQRCDDFTSWINVGLCLYNINHGYLVLWNDWSKLSEKYKNGDCVERWSKFKGGKNGFKIGSLLSWAKIDDPVQYNILIQKKKIDSVIKKKYPKDNLILGNTIIVDNASSYTCIDNEECLIKGDLHQDMPRSMYVDIINQVLAIKCRHPECFGKIYPCKYLSLNKK
jgi:hypothetical protein